MLVLEADLTDTDRAGQAVSRAADELGRLDILVNNAGLLYPGPVAEAPAEEWEQMIAINRAGVLNVTRAALPHLVAAARMAPRQVADLVNISSTAGRVARPGHGRVQPHEVRRQRSQRVAASTVARRARPCHDIAEAVTYIVTRDRRVAVNEILIRAGEQTL